MSIGARSGMLATVITLFFAPLIGGGEKVTEIRHDKLRCVKGAPIPASPEAEQLGVVGERCRPFIVKQVRVGP